MKEMMPFAPYTIELGISFLIFLFFFGWIGLQRGAKREIIVFLVATFSWLLLQEKGDILVRMANLAAKLMALIAAGGLSEEGASDPLAAVGDAQSLVTEKYEIGFLFVVWVFIVIVAYVFTNNLIKDKDSKADGWAIVWGIANGLFFASVFLPRLALLWIPKTSPSQELGAQTMPNQSMPPSSMPTDGRANIATFLSRGFDMISDAIAGLWLMLGPIQPYVLLILLTLFLILVYSTIQKGKGGGWVWSRTTVAKDGGSSSKPKS